MAAIIDVWAQIITRAWPRRPGWRRFCGGPSSNWRMLSLHRCLAKLDALGLSEAQTDAFLSGNAKRVFGLP